MTAPYGGTIVEWLVEDGDLVSPGQPLIRLHPEGVAVMTRLKPVRGAPVRADPRASAATGRPGWCRTPRSSRRSTRPTSGSAALRHRDPALGRRPRRPSPMMSVEASRKAIADAGIDAGRSTRRRRDRLALQADPGRRDRDRPQARHRQGAAFDISAGCAGFCYGLTLAKDMVRGGSAKHVLVIGVERLSDLTDLEDRGNGLPLRRRRRRGRRRSLRRAGHRPDRLGLRRRQVRR